MAILFYVCSNYLASFLWDKFGFDYALATMIIVNFFNLIGIILSRNYFLYEILFGRFCYGYILIF